MKNQTLMETVGSDVLSAGKTKKESKKKEIKKRKASEAEDEEDKSETSSELVDPANSKVKNGEVESAKKKAKVEEEVGEEDVEANVEEHPNAISKYRISDPLNESLFPIQAMTFDIVLDGCDLVGRARTGQVI